MSRIVRSLEVYDPSASSGNQHTEGARRFYTGPGSSAHPAFFPACADLRPHRMPHKLPVNERMAVNFHIPYRYRMGCVCYCPSHTVTCCDVNGERTSDQSGAGECCEDVTGGIAGE